MLLSNYDRNIYSLALYVLCHICCCGDGGCFRAQVVGVIVRLEKEAFKVLTQHGKEVTVPQHAVQPRKTRAVALDSSGNSVTARDIVKVVHGPHKVCNS